MNVYEADGLNFLVEVDLQNPAITTLNGATVMVHAQSLKDAVVQRNGTVVENTAPIIEGVAAVVSDTAIECSFPEWALTPERYKIQVRAVVAGYPPQTVADFTQIISDNLVLQA